MRAFTASRSAGLRGPWLEPLDAAALYGIGAVAEGLLQKYFGSLNGCPIRPEPATLPPSMTRLPSACAEKADSAMIETANGYTTPVSSVRATSMRKPCRSAVMFGIPSDQSESAEQQIDDLDADEGNDDAAEPVDQQEPAQQHGGSDRAVFDAGERERDERD